MLNFLVGKIIQTIEEVFLLIKIIIARHSAAVHIILICEILKIIFDKVYYHHIKR
jgi:hypothetical protein